MPWPICGVERAQALESVTLFVTISDSEAAQGVEQHINPSTESVNARC
ncbi:hypothetical protein ACRAWD_02675 [Caulobacter segnis]